MHAVGGTPIEPNGYGGGSGRYCGGTAGRFGGGARGAHGTSVGVGGSCVTMVFGLKLQYLSMKQELRRRAPMNTNPKTGPKGNSAATNSSES